MPKANVYNLISEIEDMCECSICCDKYNDNRRIPRVLPCQHTFCTNCLSKQCRRQRLKCPLCNQEHYIKNGKVDTLPKDYTRNDLNGLLEKYFGHLCKECQNYYYVQYFCKTCDVQMCHFCYGQRKVERCRTHEIEKRNIPSTSQTLLTNTVNSCIFDNICYLTDHEMNELKYFCCEQSCCIPVCANCVIDSHKGHTFKTVVDEYNERRKQLLGYCRATRNKITSAKNLLMTIQKNYYIVHVRIRFWREFVYLKDFKRQPNKAAIERYQSYLRMLDEREERVKLFIKKSTECRVISEEALSRESMIAFLSKEKTLSEKMRPFSQSDVDVPLSPMPTDFEFELQTPPLGLAETMMLLSENRQKPTKNIPCPFKKILLLWALLVSSCVLLSLFTSN
uniref:Tripartite motif-containing protein 45-like n=1 Tax=Crassostrea virginica TaxID=6565 RepID=A0A8B8BHG5_CRAVI|nr:tripartite motif-containing protein 45-like [Crassostrea virginica]